MSGWLGYRHMGFAGVDVMFAAWGGREVGCSESKSGHGGRNIGYWLGCLELVKVCLDLGKQ